MLLRSAEVQNSRFPLVFSVIFGEGQSGKERVDRAGMVCHAGVLIEGMFDVNGSTYPYAFVERWPDGVQMTFYKVRDAIHEHIPAYSFEGDAKISLLVKSRQHGTVRPWRARS